AKTPVAAERSRAGEDQIAQTGETEEGRGLGAERDSKAHDFGQSSSNERGARIFPQSEPLTEAGGDRHDVLERARDLHADHVSIRVDPEYRCCKYLLEQESYLVFG